MSKLCHFLLHHQAGAETHMLDGKYPICGRQMQEADFIMKIKLKKKTIKRNNKVNTSPF